MKKIIVAILIILLSNSITIADETKETENVKTNQTNAKLPKINFSDIGFRKSSELSDELQIKDIFNKYAKFSNSKDLNGFLSLHSDDYYSSDGYDKDRLSKFAQESWNEFPKVNSTFKILSVNVNIDNASVIAKETLSGYTLTQVAGINSSGFIDAESTTIYYLKKYSNEWKIVSDYVINEKSALRYGIARFLPMQLDAPSIMTPDTQYTAIVKMNLPSKYIALVSINNEVITQQHIKSDEVFRSVKSSGIRERVLTSNDGSKNENAVASIGIVQSETKDDNINIEIVGMAFLSSRVNVIKHKLEDTDIEKVAKDKKVNNDKKE